MNTYAHLPLFGDSLKRAVAAVAAFLLFTTTDLFCGAGGTTTGFEKASFQGSKIVRTVQVVNHDALAIASHEANHADAIHYIEDITQLDANRMRRTAGLWASLECTNFSNAKGGQSRDADSRSLAEHMERYIRAIRPLYFFVENVREFLSWGPLVQKMDKYGKPCTRRVKLMQDVLGANGKPKLRKNGKPVQRQVVNADGELAWEDAPVMIPESRTKGRDFIRWKQSIEDLGYTCHFKLLNAADYGERTSRVRLFMIFAQTGLPVRWPEATHSKDGKTVGTAPWLPVRPCLNLEQKGQSIFGRDVALVEKTLKRIYAGLCKYIAGSDVATVTRYLQDLASGKSGGSRPEPKQEAGWLMKRSSNPPSGEANPGVSLNDSAPTLATCFHPDLVQPEFLAKTFTGNPEHLIQSVGQPAGTVTTVDHHQLVQTEFLSMRHHGNDASRARSLNSPGATITTHDHHTLIQTEFLTQYNGGSDDCRNLSLNGPANTITTENRFGLVQPEFISKYYGSGDNVTSVAAPAGTITTKDRMGLVQTEWLDKRYGSGDHNHQGLTYPAGTITTNDHHAVVQTEFLDKNYGSGEHNHQSVEQPAGSLTTKEKMALVQTEFLDQQYGQSTAASTQQPAGSLTGVPKLNLIQTEFLAQSNGGPEASKVTSVEHPARTVLASPNQSLIQAEPWVMPTSFDNTGRSLDEPSPTLLASRQHHYLVQPEAAPEPWLLDNKFDNVGRDLNSPGPTLLTGDHHYIVSPFCGPEPKHWQEQESDCETMRLIRQFMRAYGLSDVLMRMLMVEELLKIQGFPDGYVLLGSSTEQKKFIGNSVPPKMSQRIIEAIYEALHEADLLYLLAEYEGSEALAA